jgi:hypothetical protein
MKYKFDATKIKVSRVKIKSLNSMSGTINVLDETVVGKEKTYKMECPNALTRTFKAVYGLSHFSIPHECCIVTYDGMVIALEKALLNERYYKGIDNEDKLWTPDVVKRLERVKEMTANGDWYFDGSYAFNYGDSLENVIDNGDALDDRGKFKSIKCKAIMLNYLGYYEDIYEETRICLGYKSNTGEFAISPPIWRGETFTKSEEVSLSKHFDKLDTTHIVNLQFAILAGINLTRIFGYRSIEPLQLPKLMKQLVTVNLQSIPKEIKQTFDIGMSVTQAYAWVMGLMIKVESLDDYVYMKRLLRYVSTTGTTKRTRLSDVLKVPEISIPLLTMDQAYENAMQKGEAND